MRGYGCAPPRVIPRIGRGKHPSAREAIPIAVDRQRRKDGVAATLGTLVDDVRRHHPRFVGRDRMRL